MSRTARASDMRHKVKAYKQVNVRDSETGKIKQMWKYDFYLWCKPSTVFREQLQASVSGAKTLRNRIEFETRYPTRLTTRNRIVYNNEMFEVSIVGDTEGTHNTVRFLAEALEDGGA